MKNINNGLAPADLFVQEILTQSLRELGDYVYGYYRPKETVPFYVGKGKDNRVLVHWKNACEGNLKFKQCQEIDVILKTGEIPCVKLLAYNLEKTSSNEVYTVVERVLQNTFGIEKNVDERAFKSRVKHDYTLVQDRDEGTTHPTLSLEAAYCRGLPDKSAKLDPRAFASACVEPVLLVGLSKSYHASYSQIDLAEMARMYWSLDRFENTSFPILRESESGVLAAWTSDFGGPQIVGIWRIKKGTFKKTDSGRCKCDYQNDFALRKKLLGVRLQGDGHSYQGPHIYASFKA